MVAAVQCHRPTEDDDPRLRSLSCRDRARHCPGLLFARGCLPLPVSLDGSSFCPVRWAYHYIRSLVE
eukprot:61739-Hanusia_phi.AAC.1